MISVEDLSKLDVTKSKQYVAVMAIAENKVLCIWENNGNKRLPMERLELGEDSIKIARKLFKAKVGIELKKHIDLKYEGLYLLKREGYNDVVSLYSFVVSKVFVPQMQLTKRTTGYSWELLTVVVPNNLDADTGEILIQTDIMKKENIHLNKNKGYQIVRHEESKPNKV